MKKDYYETGENIPAPDLFSVRVTILIAALAFITALMLPSSGRAQIQNWPPPTIDEGNQKKDTVWVDILCDIDLGYTPKCWPCKRNVEIVKVRQERVFQYEENKSPMIYGVYKITREWVVKETRWLDPVKGCYQLVPLQNDK